MNTISVYVVDAKKVFFQGRAVSVTVPATDGEKAFMAHHEEMALVLVPGNMRIRLADDTVIEAVISEGVADVANNRVNIMVFSCEKPEDVESLREREKKEREEEEERQKKSILEYHMSRATMARTMNKLAHPEEEMKYSD